MEIKKLISIYKKNNVLITSYFNKMNLSNKEESIC